IQDVLDVMQTATGDTAKSMVKAGEAASKTFGNQWKIAKDNVVESVGRVMLPLIEKMTPVISKVAAGIPGFIDKISSGISKITDVVGPVFSKAWKGASKTISNFAKTGGKVLSSFTSAAGPGFSKLMDAVGPLVGQVFELAKSFSPLGAIFKVIQPVLDRKSVV